MVDEKEKLRKLLEEYAKPWDDLYEELSDGHFSLFRFHLSYMPHIYPKYFFLEDVSSRIVSQGLYIDSSYDTYSQKLIKKIEMKNEEKTLILLRKISLSIKKNEKDIITNHLGLSLRRAEYNFVLPFLEEKLTRTKSMLFNLRDIQKEPKDLKEGQIIKLVEDFKNQPEYLLIIMFFFSEIKTKQIMQYMIHNQPELFNFLLNDTWDINTLKKRLTIPTEGKDKYIKETLEGATEELMKEVDKVVMNFQAIKDTYLPIRLMKNLQDKAQVQRQKI